MLDYFKKIPCALAGLVLSISALAKLLMPFLPLLSPFLQGLAILGILALLLRLATDRRGIKEEFQNPVVASCFATLLMAIQLLTSSLPLPRHLGHLLWYLTLLAYVAYIIFFTYRFARQRNLALVYPSWFIVYVGFAMTAVSAPTFQEYTLGWFALLFASLSFLVLAPLILLRLFKHRIDNRIRPILAIFAAPVSLILTGYLSLVDEAHPILTAGTLVFSQIIYGLVIVFFYHLTEHGFSPLYSAFTFPLVSTAIGLRLSIARLSVSLSFLHGLSYVEIVIATAVILYVLYGYVRLLIHPILFVTRTAEKLEK